MIDFFRDGVILVLWMIAFFGLIGICLLLVWFALLEAMGWRNERRGEEGAGKYRAEREGRRYESFE